jgi:AcrR family transcriptional regulator
MVTAEMPVLECHASEKAEQLVDCAFRLFSERGIAKVNMDAIAAEASVTKGSLYHHFRSKKEVILAACNLYYRNWQRSVAREVVKGTTVAEKLDLAIRFSVRSCLMDKANRVFTMEILTLSLYDADVRSSWAQFYDTARNFYINLIADAENGKGHRDFEEIEERVDLMLCAMEGVKQRAHFERQLCSKKNEELISRQLLNMVR